VAIFEEEEHDKRGGTLVLGCILQLSNGRKVNVLKHCVPKVATAVNMMLYNMFLQQVAAVITPSHEVSFPCTVEDLTYLSISVVAGQCLLTQA
jgi:hypothetical protein